VDAARIIHTSRGSACTSDWTASYRVCRIRVRRPIPPVIDRTRGVDDRAQRTNDESMGIAAQRKDLHQRDHKRPSNSLHLVLRRTVHRLVVQGRTPAPALATHRRLQRWCRPKPSHRHHGDLSLRVSSSSRERWLIGAPSVPRLLCMGSRIQLATRIPQRSRRPSQKHSSIHERCSHRSDRNRAGSKRARIVSD
jgi:hypothetical protein